MRYTVEQIVDEISAAYTLNTRSVAPSHACVYNGPNNTHCAFGKMCVDPTGLTPYEGHDADGVLGRLGMDVLKPEYRGYPIDFYLAIQHLHDCENHWTEKGLSHFGMDWAVQTIKKFSHCNNIWIDLDGTTKPLE